MDKLTFLGRLILLLLCLGRQWFCREVYDSAPNLHGFVVERQQRGPLFHENQRSELRCVVFEEELAILKLDFGMAATDRNIIDPQVALVAAPELEHCLLRARPDYVDDPAVVLFLRKTFEDHVVALWLVVLYQVVVPSIGLHHQRVG